MGSRNLLATATSSSSPAPKGGSIDLPTLAVTAAASAAAAYTCSKIWAPGTLASAAFMPVLVSLLKEAIQRPARAVAQAVPVRGVVRSARPGEAPAAPVEDVVVAQQGEVRYHSSSKHGRRGWKVAIVTGLLGFLVAAIVLTVPELMAGTSASGGGRGTTLFGGEDRQRGDSTRTTTAPTGTQTVTAPAAKTVTVPAPAETQTTPEPAPEIPATPAPVPPGTPVPDVPAPGAPAPAPPATPPAPPARPESPLPPGIVPP